MIEKPKEPSRARWRSPASTSTTRTVFDIHPQARALRREASSRSPTSTTTTSRRRQHGRSRSLEGWWTDAGTFESLHRRHEPGRRRAVPTASTCEDPGRRRRGGHARSPGRRGRELRRALTSSRPRTRAATGCGSLALDIVDADRGLDALVGEVKPDVVINCCGLHRGRRLRDEPRAAFAVNAACAGASRRRPARTSGPRSVHMSTDYVFDGEKDGPTSSPTRPNPPADLRREQARRRASGDRGWHPADARHRSRASGSTARAARTSPTPCSGSPARRPASEGRRRSASAADLHPGRGRGCMRRMIESGNAGGDSTI